MEVNRNKELSQFFMLWKMKNESNKIDWLNFISNFSKKKSFLETLNELINEEFGQMNLFDEHYNNFLYESKKYEDLWNRHNIKSLVFDDFYLVDSLKRVKNSLFFFYVGNIKILNKSEDELISVIGSRKTPSKYENWIRNNVPKNKVIVSGLANGADCFAHKYSINLNNEIVVIPGVDIFTYNFNNIQEVILRYAKSKGLILTNIIPFSKYHSNFNYLKRNKWMAQISSETYAIFFTGQSGTLGQLYETAKLDKKIYMPKDVYNINKDFLSNHKYFNILVKKNKNIGVNNAEWFF